MTVRASARGAKMYDNFKELFSGNVMMSYILVPRRLADSVFHSLGSGNGDRCRDDDRRLEIVRHRCK